ncbi:hypothetical protein GCM10010466_46190 [Planomonospora alba]|uniref:NlpC/P60 domain-containing protein n=1 Tax=Planomonospora alba TaxID=161354 RepID=A0ABP6NL00_9ACTN
MSITDTVARIGQLDAMFGTAAAPATTAASPSSAADFAAALETARRSPAAQPAAAQPTAQPAAVRSPAATQGVQAADTGAVDAAVTGRDVVAQARKYLGVPYLWGGTDPGKGLDCSGLVQLVYKKLGISLPRVSQDQQNEGRSIPSLKQAQPGDLLTFGSPATHIGIYVGDGKMLHAPRTGDVVKIVDLDDYYRAPTDIRRILSDEAAGAGATAPATAAASTAPATAAASTTASGTETPAARPVTASALPAAGLTSPAGTPAGTGVSAELLAALALIQTGYGTGLTSSGMSAGLPQLSPAAADGVGNGLFDPAQAYVIQSALNGIG